ncbi:solute carrier family 35 member G1 isoform X2 [Folsomia candida]|nr:solute carrier family 35 member G1 isoform X2 [Folsomia candida]
MSNSAPTNVHFPSSAGNVKEPIRSGHDNLGATKDDGDVLSVIVPRDPILGAETISISPVRNCGIVLDQEKSKQPNTDNKTVKKSTTQTGKEGWRKFGGIIFGVLSSLCFSLTLLLAKVLREQYDYHPICVTIWRYVGILAPAIPISIYYHFCTSEPVFDSVWPMSNVKNLKHCLAYVLQGISGCSSIIFRFYSLEYITLADASVVSFSSPVLVAILAHFCLGEKCSVVSICVAILTVLGVMVIARPPLLTSGTPDDAKVWIGVLLAVVSLACGSALLILMRNIRQTHFSLMLLVGGGWGVGQSGAMGWALDVLKVPDTIWVWSLLGCLGLMTFLGQIGIIMALKYENAGPVAVIRSSEVLFAYLWQLQFFSIYPDVYSAVGASIIIFSVVVIATKSWVAGLRPDNVHRKRLIFLTK